MNTTGIYIHNTVQTRVLLRALIVSLWGGKVTYVSISSWQPSAASPAESRLTSESSRSLLPRSSSLSWDVPQLSTDARSAQHFWRLQSLSLESKVSKLASRYHRRWAQQLDLTHTDSDFNVDSCTCFHLLLLTLATLTCSVDFSVQRRALACPDLAGRSHWGPARGGWRLQSWEPSQSGHKSSAWGHTSWAWEVGENHWIACLYLLFKSLWFPLTSEIPDDSLDYWVQHSALKRQNRWGCCDSGRETLAEMRLISKLKTGPRSSPLGACTAAIWERQTNHYKVWSGLPQEIFEMSEKSTIEFKNVKNQRIKMLDEVPLT